MPRKSKALGLPEGKVFLSAYNKSWSRLFRSERDRLRRVLGRRIREVEHVGSTSVPGLCAKPVLDLAIAIKDVSKIMRLVKPLEKIGYEYKGEYGLPGRHFFVRGEPVTHHLHFVESGSDHWRVWLLFRDYLRRHPSEAARYEKFKRAKARKYASDRAAYTGSKSAFVEKMLRKAEAEAE